MKLFALRHFQRYDDTSFYSSLTLEGFTQSLAIVEKLVKLGITHVYASPFLRVMQSVYPFVNMSAAKEDMQMLRVRVEPMIGEMRNNENFEPAHLFERGVNDIPLKFFSIIDWSYNPMAQIFHVDKPEQFEDVVERTMQFMHSLSENHGDNDRVLIVTHSSVINAFRRIYNVGDNVDDTPFPYGEVLEIDIEKN